MTLTSKKNFRKIQIEMEARMLAWADLDKHDKRLYLTEAEKLVNKREKECTG